MPINFWESSESAEFPAYVTVFFIILLVGILAINNLDPYLCIVYPLFGFVHSVDLMSAVLHRK